MYPLTAYDSNGKNPIPVASVKCSDSGPLSVERKNVEPSSGESPSSSATTPAMDKETRKVINMMCNVKPKDSSGETELTVLAVNHPCYIRKIFFAQLKPYFQITILLRMEDKMNRQLTCSLTETDTAETLVQELMYYGFINEVSFLLGKNCYFQVDS